jgi:hypothetical protein
MKTVDLCKEQRSLVEVLALAKSDTVIIHTDSGEDFLLEHADEFDREAAELGGSEKFMSFLEGRSKETGDIPIGKIRESRGL